MVHAAQEGGKAASPEVAKVAKNMSKKDAKDFASGSMKGKPEHKAPKKHDPGYTVVDQGSSKVRRVK
jgi:hypothetical protein